MDKMTGAKIGKRVVALSLLIALGSFGISNVKNDSSKELSVKIEQMTSGAEKTLKNMILDLREKGATNIKYHDSVTIDTLPNGYLYIEGKGVKFTNFIEERKVINAEEVIEYNLPSSYSETTLKTGEKVGVISIEPTKVSLGNSLTYDMNVNGMETSETLTWNEEEEKFEKYILTKSVNYDVVTYCNKDNVLAHNFIYLPEVYGEMRVVRYSEQIVDDLVGDENTEEYEVNRIVKFYTDGCDAKTLANTFSGHLGYGEFMKLYSQGDGITSFLIYRQRVKNNAGKVK